MPPPSPWLAALCALLGAPLALFYFRHAERQPAKPRRILGFACAGMVLGGLGVAGRLALGRPDVPYNVRELVGDYPTLSLIALSVALMACGSVPMALGTLWWQRPRAFVRHFTSLIVAVGTLVFVAVWMVVPIESVDDIVGTPVLGINFTLERWLRFVPLFGGLLSGWTIGARLAFRDVQGRHMIRGLAVTTAALLVSYIVVVPLAATNNIYELLRGRGGAVAALSIAGYLILVSFVFAMLARSIVVARARVALVVPPVLLALSVPIGWQLFVLASNPRLVKYGQVFSARQFLLSPDREHYLDDEQLFPRFALAHLGVALIMASGAALVLAVARTRMAGTPDAGRTAAASVGAVLGDSTRSV